MKECILSILVFVTATSFAKGEFEGSWKFLGSSRGPATGEEKDMVWEIQSGIINFLTANTQTDPDVIYTARYTLDASTSPIRINYYQDKIKNGRILRTEHRIGILRYDNLILMIKFSGDTENFPDSFDPCEQESKIHYFIRKPEPNHEIDSAYPDWEYNRNQRPGLTIEMEL